MMIFFSSSKYEKNLFSGDEMTFVNFCVKVHHPSFNSFTFDEIVRLTINDNEKAPYSIFFNSEFSQKLIVESWPFAVIPKAVIFIGIKNNSL